MRARPGLCGCSFASFFLRPGFRPYCSRRRGRGRPDVSTGHYRLWRTLAHSNDRYRHKVEKVEKSQSTLPHHFTHLSARHALHAGCERTDQVSEARRRAMANPGASARICWICGKSVPLEECKIDEHGLAVHEECYTRVTVQKQMPSRPYASPL